MMSWLRMFFDGQGFSYTRPPIMEYRQSRKWYVSIAVVGLFSFILALMIFFMAQGKDVTEGWKEILLLMLGGFVGSFAKVIDFWFNNQENDNKLLEHADD